MKSTGEPGRSRDLASASALAIAAFLLYLAGACRTIYVGDSGELVAAVYTLGIPHPSGYPLYVLLGKLWTLLVPVGSIAFRMSLFSALFAALTVAMTYLAARELGVARRAAAAVALLCAISPSFWGEANVQRVYALNAFCVALATWLAFRWDAARAGGAATLAKRDRLFVAIAGTAGLGATNHTFVAVWGLCFLGYALVREPELLRRVRTLASAASAAIAGLSIYLYLPLRSRAEPRLDWGNPETLEALAGVVTRRDFWQRRWWTGWNDLPPIALDFFGSFAVELTFAGAALALFGLFVGARRRKPVPLLVLVILANLAVMAAHGSRSDLFLWHRYYLPAYLCATWLAAIGLDAVMATLRRFPPAASRAAWALVFLALGGLGASRYADFDRSRYEIADAYSRELLASLPPGAHLAATDDNILFVLIYLQLVEGVRPDVDLIFQGVGGELPALRFDPDREALFFTHHPNWNLPQLDVVPVGQVFQVVRAGSRPPLRLPATLRLPGEDDARVPKDYLTRNLIGELHFALGVTFENLDRDRALGEFAEAARVARDNDVLFYNLGLVYERMERFDLAIAAFERSAEINPRPIPGPSRVRAQDRLEILRRRNSQG